MPSGTKVFAIHKDSGEQHELEQTLYEPKTFEKLVLNGDYRIHIDLPKGYRAVENDVFYSVGERINRFLTTFVEVTEDNPVNPTPAPRTNPSPAPVPNPLSPDKTLVPDKEIGKEKEEHQLSQKRADLRPMYVKPSEKNAQGGQESANQDAKETLPKTGQESLVSVFLSGFGMVFLALVSKMASKKREGN